MPNLTCRPKEFMSEDSLNFIYSIMLILDKLLIIDRVGLWKAGDLLK